MKLINWKCNLLTPDYCVDFRILLCLYQTNGTPDLGIKLEENIFSVWRHHFFIRYKIIQELIYLIDISHFVKMSEKVVAPYGKLSGGPSRIW